MRVFEIGGDEYPIPTLSSFSMDEAIVFFNVNGYPVEDLWLVPDEEDADERLERLRNPAVVKALLHVAYRRGNPDRSDKEIGRIIGQVSLAVALSAFIPDPEEAPAVPLGRTSEPNGSSLRSSLDAPENSGSGSETSSAPPGSGLSPTGTSESAMSRASDPVMSAA